jgi:aryl-alcohol dehydrogenase-like predicted oxidoreductase
MHYRQLGASGLRISEIGLGSWLTYGVSVDPQRSGECIRRAFDLGINFFDTANMYGRGAAESLLGTLLSVYRREDYVLSTKVYFPMSTTDRGLSRAQIHKQLDASLRRLRTDYVDVYFCHRYDDETPLQETMEAMTEVVASGKARYIGFSQWTARQIEAAHPLDRSGRMVASSPQYSMLRRRAEWRVFPLCRKLGIGQVVWSPLAQGVLSGKYPPGGVLPAGSRAVSGAARRGMSRFTERRVLEAVERLRPIAARLSLSLSQLALAWVLREAVVSSAIIGATHPGQIDENAGASGVRLDQETCRQIDEALGDVVRR